MSPNRGPENPPADEDEIPLDEWRTTCSLCGVESLATAWRERGLCPACGAEDPDADFNRPIFLAMRRARRATSAD